MAAGHLQAKGLDEADASRLASAFSKMDINDPGAIDAHLKKFAALRTPLSAQDWCSCFSRCTELLSLSPPVLQERVSKLQELMQVDSQQAVSTVVKAPSLLQHDPAGIAAKVGALQAVMALPEEAASAQLIIERFSRYPPILARSVEALEAQLSGLAGLLGCDLQRASRLAFKVPALAAAGNEELEAHMNLLVQLLSLDMESVQGLVLRQPSLLSRTPEGLQAKVEAYAEIFGDETGQALAAAPQLLTMKVDAVKSRFELLSQLADLQSSWATQLEEATSETLAVWLCSSEKKLRRLEIAAQSQKLCRLQLYRLLSHSESRWISELASAGLAPDGTATGPAAADGTGGAAAGSKPKRPRGGRREREKQERAAARAAAAAAGSSFSAPGSSSQPAAAGDAAGPAAGAAPGKPKRPRGGKRERERRERIARRQAEAAAAGEGSGGEAAGARYSHAAADTSGPRGPAAAGGGGGSSGDGAAAAGQHSVSENAQGGGSAGAADRPRRTRGGRREREKRERREAHAAGGGADGSDGDNGGTYSGDGEGEGGQRPKRATRGGRREREKRERLAARLAAATATAAATAALDAF